MPTESPTIDAAPADAKQPLRNRLIARMAALLEWAGQSRFRMALVGGAGLTVLLGLFVAWSMLARMAVSPVRKYDLNMALTALDDGRFEEARAVIGQLQHLPSSQQTIGGALFVLGAAKAHEAESEWSADRRRAMHLVAARYLQKARTLGVPEDRESQLLFRLGVSFVQASQVEAGIEALEQALERQDLPHADIRRMLVSAHMQTADPDLPKALFHVDQVLADDSLAPPDRLDLQAVQAELLFRLDRMPEARQAIDQLRDQPAASVAYHLLTGRLDVRQAKSLPKDDPQRSTLLDSARAHFRQVAQSDATDGASARQAQYWSAAIVELRGDSARAIELNDQLSKALGDAPEGLAAQLSKADLELADGQYDDALGGLRRVLESIADPALFVNPVVSLSELRRRMLAAHQQFIDADQYEQALALVELFEPVFSHLERIELRARTHTDWGNSLALDAMGRDDWDATELADESRYHLRAAGRAYEDLARLRFASPLFTDDLLTAAQNYFDGQSYSHAIRLIEEYLRHEARRHNAQALLLLGEAKLARNDPSGAIAALRECIEMYPRDEAVYQARLVRAQAHRRLCEYEAAEQLLLKNLYGDDLTPKSIQWRDSLFTLGHLLFDAGRYDEAIANLQHAVERYPDAEDFLLAKYVIGRANQQAADVHAQKFREAKTLNEQQKNRDEMNRYLESALQTFEEVQRVLALRGLSEGNLLHHTLLRNCYMMQGSVLFELKRYEEARQAFSDIVTYYQGEPYVLEAFVQVSNCWRRLDEPVKARATMQSAVLALSRMPQEIDFRLHTNFSRQQWELMFDQMKQW